ncbi:MAG TPA: hypothetical protein VGN27_09540 [Gaiellaceae bacterium]|jgi:hypothetical protein|nr:hypothetical protein [Gaiellaceae bacterium]
MIKRVVVVGVVILALMIVVKDGRVLRDAGLTGSCSIAQTFGDGTQLEACRAGKLAGRPDLSHDGCKDVGVTGTYEYWRCPASVQAGPNG